MTSSAKFTLWSTKRVLIWLRAHGYTPLEHHITKTQCNYKTSSLNNDEENDENKISNCDYISSLTPYDRLLNNEFSNLKPNNEGNRVDFIDIIGNNTILEDLDENKDRIKLKKNAESLELNSNYDYLLEMSNGAKYVKGQLNVVIKILINF